MTNGRNGKATLIVSYDVDDVMAVELLCPLLLLWTLVAVSVEEDHRS